MHTPFQATELASPQTDPVAVPVASHRPSPMDLPKTEPGLTRQRFFGAAIVDGVNAYVQVFAYYARYAEASGTLSMEQFCAAVPEVMALIDLSATEQEVMDAVTRAEAAGIFHATENGFELTYDGDCEAYGMVGDEANDMLWAAPWITAYAYRLGAKTRADRLVACIWYLEQCQAPVHRRDIPTGPYGGDGVGVIEADAMAWASPGALAYVLKRGWVSLDAGKVLTVTTAGKERIDHNFPSLRGSWQSGRKSVTNTDPS